MAAQMGNKILWLALVFIFCFIGFWLFLEKNDHIEISEAAKLITANNTEVQLVETTKQDEDHALIKLKTSIKSISTDALKEPIVFNTNDLFELLPHEVYYKYSSIAESGDATAQYFIGEIFEACLANIILKSVREKEGNINHFLNESCDNLSEITNINNYQDGAKEWLNKSATQDYVFAEISMTVNDIEDFGKETSIKKIKQALIQAQGSVYYTLETLSFIMRYHKHYGQDKNADQKKNIEYYAWLKLYEEAKFTQFNVEPSTDSEHFKEYIGEEAYNKVHERVITLENAIAVLDWEAMGLQ